MKSWRCLMTKKSSSADGVKSFKKKQWPYVAVLCTATLFFLCKTSNYECKEKEIKERWRLLDLGQASHVSSSKIRSLPRGIVHDHSDLELRSLWSRSSSRSKVSDYSHRNLLAIPAGIKQKYNVDAMVQKFLPENFTIILFHYDGKVDGWRDFDWNEKAIHIVALNQTKWWFAKRFLHPDIVSVYDYIFLWDEDLGLENFSPVRIYDHTTTPNISSAFLPDVSNGRYLKIVRAEGLEISQPALHPNSTDIHHRITIRARSKMLHRRVYDRRGKTKCSEASEGPPCTGFVEGMAPVFSRDAWFCTWHLIQNDLVHAWGLDMKLGYCAQGDRTKKVGVVDREYIVHEGIQTLGGNFKRKGSKTAVGKNPGQDVRIEIRRQSTWDQETFKVRWNKAVAEDKEWVDPFRRSGRLRRANAQRSS